jgi:hypothetical protein
VGYRDLDRFNLLNQYAGLGTQAGFSKIAADTFLQVASLANIQHAIVTTQHAVNTRA